MMSQIEFELCIINDNLQVEVGIRIWMVTLRLKDLLISKIGKMGESAYSSLDIVGEIAIVKVPYEMEDYKMRIGEAVMEINRHVKAVYAQTGAVQGTYRLKSFEHIAGEPMVKTIHREYGCRYLVDIEKTYFSPRLSEERRRIAQLVQSHEVVVNMFAGVGPFSILIAKMHPEVKVYSIDLNPEAIELHKVNCRLNKVEDRVFPIEGDAREILDGELKTTADRVLMPLPQIALECLNAALTALKKRGMIHVYLHCPYEKDMEEALAKGVESVQNKLREFKVEVQYVSSHRVREVGTRILQICVDTKVDKGD